MFEATTHNIKIVAQPTYLDLQSYPEESHYVWAYTINIENLGERTVTLLRRYWKITDGGGQVQEVEGDGVVGEQPTLEPSMVFQYTSGVVLTTASGIMTGIYEFADVISGDVIKVEIPTFSLDTPEATARAN